VHIVNNYFVSNLSDVHLFKRAKGIRYTEIQDTNIKDKVWRLFSKEHPFVKNINFGHLYIKAELWSGNSDALLIALWGHADTVFKGKYYVIDPWRCVFDINNLSVSMDLGLMNRKSLHD